MYEIPDYTFADDELARLKPRDFIAYAHMRANGQNRRDALIAAFKLWRVTSDFSRVEFWAALCDGNPFVVEEKRKYLKTKASTLAGAGEIASVYLEIAMNPNERGSARVSAAREYCVLKGLTVIDENGNSKRQMEAEEFMAMLDAEATEREGAKSARQPATKH